jgi:Flp pilus assembly protein TadD
MIANGGCSNMSTFQPFSLLSTMALGLLLFSSGNTLATAEINHLQVSQISEQPVSPLLTVTKYIVQGKKLVKIGDIRGAEAALRKAVQLDPNSVEAHNGLGLLLGVQGKIEESIVEFRQVLRLDPNDVQAHNNLGGALLLQGKIEESIVEFRPILRLDPNDVQAHNNLGLVLLSQGKLEAAIAELKQARDLFNTQGMTQMVDQINHRLQQMKAQ